MAEKGKTVSYNFAGPDSYQEANLFVDALDNVVPVISFTSWSSDRNSIIVPKTWEEKADSIFARLFPNDSL
jgi:hypothetical protein